MRQIINTAGVSVDRYSTCTQVNVVEWQIPDVCRPSCVDDSEDQRDAMLGGGGGPHGYSVIGSVNRQQRGRGHAARAQADGRIGEDPFLTLEVSKQRAQDHQGMASTVCGKTLYNYADVVAGDLP